VWELLKAPQQPPAQAVEDMEPAGQAATTGDATAVAHACSEQEASLEADYTQPADELDEPEDPGLVPSTGKPADQPLEDPFVDADASCSADPLDLQGVEPGADPALLCGSALPESDLAAEPAANGSPGNGAGAARHERPSSPLLQVNGSWLVPGRSFALVKRAPGCPVEEIAGPVPPESLKRIARPGGSLHVWNTAEEAIIIGAGRQMLASKVPMSCASDGKYRMDFRVLSGTEVESAHLLEVGVAAAPWLGAHFKPNGPGADRPQLALSGFAAPSSPFYRIVPLTDLLIEGVRLSVEVDFQEKMVRLRNVPEVEGVEEISPTPMAVWLRDRARLLAMNSRPSGELDDPLFREQAQHLHELIGHGALGTMLTNAVLNDGGAQCVIGSGMPEVAEEYYFYVVVPAGMELELF